MILDVRTMGIVSAITPIVLGFIILVYLRERKVYDGFRRWLLANFGLGVGYLLVTLRDLIPDFFSIILGNVIVVYCAILIHEGIRRFYGNPSYDRLNYLVLGVYILLQTGFTYVLPNINARVALSGLTVFFLLLRSAKSLFQGTIPGLSKIARSAGYAFLVTSLFPFTRAVFALLQPEPIDFFSDVMNSWFSAIFIFAIVVWTFYFFFLNSARLELELESARRELDHIASTDPLTSLYNRRHFNEHAEMEFQRAKRYGYPLSFLFIDADEFKAINDAHGHKAGDVALESLSAILRSEVRSFDLVARFGGDEFVVMLVDADNEQAIVIAERIRNAVERHSIVFDSRTLNVRLSVGVATVGNDDVNLGMVLRRGDKALYAAKRHGRNQIFSV